MLLRTWMYRYLFETQPSVPLGIYPKVELLGVVILFLIFLRNFPTVFHHVCTILHSHQKCTSIPSSPYPCQHLLLCLFDNSHPDGCEVQSHCGFDLHWPNDLEYRISFMCLRVIHVPSSEKYLFRSLAHFKIRWFGIFLLNFKSSLYTLDINPLADTWFISIFSCPVGCTFTR